VSVGGSIGFALYPFSVGRPQAVPWDRVLAVSDRALYMAKERGRRAWVGIACNERAPLADDIKDILADPSSAAGRGAISISVSGWVDRPTGTEVDDGAPAIGRRAR
jgi:hypothetical protein